MLRSMPASKTTVVNGTQFVFFYHVIDIARLDVPGVMADDRVAMHTPQETTMIRFTQFISVPTICLIAACSNSGANYTPVIDGPVGPNYTADLSQCQALAASQAQIDSRTAAAAATGAGVAGASSVIVNDNSDDLAEAAAVGAVVGLTGDAIQKNANREVIIRNCMRSRGYNVVG
jgi:hypothetical protein